MGEQETPKVEAPKPAATPAATYATNSPSPAAKKISEDGTTYSALSAVCTHLGCNVHIHEEGGFRCPCHDAYFAPDGEVVSGPPRRSLVRLETKIEAGIVSVLI